MTGSLERDVAGHYGVGNLQMRILEGLQATGVDTERLQPKDLAPVDEFHIGGRPATEHAVAKMGLTKDQHVLDVGCGIGGATRYLASEIGCRVTGIDLTPEYIEVARDLAARTGLSSKISYEVASALAMPFENQHFDAAITMHVAMNIKDRDGLYREVARVLKPGAKFCVYDVMKGVKDGLRYPVPWAETEDTSHLTTPHETAALLEGAGLMIEEVEDRKQAAITFFRERLTMGASGPAPLGLHLLMGENGREKMENMLANIAADQISPVIMIAHRAR